MVADSIHRKLFASEDVCSVQCTLYSVQQYGDVRQFFTAPTNKTL